MHPISLVRMLCLCLAIMNLLLSVASPSSSFVTMKVPIPLFFLKADKVHGVIVMEHDICETQEWMEPKLNSLVAVWPRHLSSPGHFVMMSK